MSTAIEAIHLTKRFGRISAVDDLSFEVPAGCVTGFVGPNGAGKSTTMRAIVGLDRPDGGRALVNGRRYADLRRPLREVGALLDAAWVHPGRRASHHLLWLARSNGIPRRRVAEVLELVGLAGAGRRRVRGFSLGMRQRLGIAAALLGDPPVLVLDEPANGLDPDGIVWLRGFLRSLAAEGRAVLVSSHLLAELEDAADRLVVIGDGRLIAETGVAELLASTAGGGVRLRTPRLPEVMELLAAAGGTVSSAGADVLTVTGLDAARIARLVTEQGLPLHELAPQRATLEEAFLQLTGEVGVTAALRAEWTKLVTLRGTRWTLLAIVALTVALGVLLASGSSSTPPGAGGDNDLVRDSLVGVYLAQFAVVAFGVLSITAEHATGTIHATFVALPRRARVLLAKALLVGGAVLLAGLAGAVAAFEAGQRLLRDNGYSPPGYPEWTLHDGPARRAVLGSALLLAAIAVLGLGLGAILRNGAAAISALLALLFVPLILAPALPERAGDLALTLTPGAGFAVQKTVLRDDAIPIAPWAGLGVTCAWAAGTLLVALVLVRRRDG